MQDSSFAHEIATHGSALPVLLIPVFASSETVFLALQKIVFGTLANPAQLLIIVNDGCPPQAGAFFEKYAAEPRLHLVSHHSNQGKGAALKTGFRHYLSLLESQKLKSPGVVTADADGQHSLEDILRVSAAFSAAPAELHLGVRSLGAGTPLASRIGNSLCCRAFRRIGGQRLSDSQTGLRGIPNSMLPPLLGLTGRRYDFEMGMLLEAARLGVPILETPIQTIYFNRNSLSHFRGVRDSTLVAMTLVRTARTHGREAANGRGRPAS